jgi:hypothetical protein
MAVDDYLGRAESGHALLFSGRCGPDRSMTTRQYARLVSGRIGRAGITRLFGTARCAPHGRVSCFGVDGPHQEAMAISLSLRSRPLPPDEQGGQEEPVLLTWWQIASYASFAREGPRRRLPGVSRNDDRSNTDAYRGWGLALPPAPLRLKTANRDA